MANTSHNGPGGEGEGSDKEPRAKRARFEFNYNDLITVLVGKDEKPFSVHKDNICLESKFFAAACSSARWLEGKEKLVRLPEVDVQAFQAYVHRVYTGDLLPTIHYGKGVVSEREERTALVEAYIIGDILIDDRQCNMALDLLISGMPNFNLPTNQLLSRIYDSTPAASPLRQLMVSWLLRNGRHSFADRVAELPREFVEDVAKSALLQLPQETSTSRWVGLDELRVTLKSTPKPA